LIREIAVGVIITTVDVLAPNYLVRLPLLFSSFNGEFQSPTQSRVWYSPRPFRSCFKFEKPVKYSFRFSKSIR